MFGVLYDKERLERDKSTVNTANYNVTEEITNKRKELEDRLAELAKSVSSSDWFYIMLTWCPVSVWYYNEIVSTSDN